MGDMRGRINVIIPANRRRRVRRRGITMGILVGVALAVLLWGALLMAAVLWFSR